MSVAIRYDGIVRPIILGDQLLDLKSKSPTRGGGQYVIQVVWNEVFFAIRKYVIVP